MSDDRRVGDGASAGHATIMVVETEGTRRDRSAVLDAAVAQVLGGDRLDVRAIATALGVSRSTVYRWFGDRDGLLAEVLDRLNADLFARARSEARGDGPERAIDLTRRFLDGIVASRVANAVLAERRADAVRILMAPSSRVQIRLARRFSVVIEECLDEPRGDPLDLAAVVTQVSMTSVWAATLAGRDPDVELAVDVARVLLLP